MSATSNEYKLTDEERRELRNVLSQADKDIIFTVFGSGSDRWLSFYAHGTRLEARISYPEKGQEER